MMLYTTVLSSVNYPGSKIVYEYTLFTKELGSGTICIWKIGEVQRISYICNTEYRIHKRVRADAKKRKNKVVGPVLLNKQKKEIA